MTEKIIIYHCANHPDIETSLRCNRCEKPICPKCAISTPTGYRCKECVQGQQKIFETAVWSDYLIGAITGASLSFVGSLIIPSLGFFIIILSPIAGVIIAEICRILIKRRRSKKLYITIAAATLAGTLPLLLSALVTGFLIMSQGGLGIIIDIALHALYSFLVTSTVYYRLSGINLNL